MIRATVFLAFLGCTLPVEARCQSTAEDRAALFDYILSKTMEREAFSPVKNQALGFDVEEAMLRYRDEFIAADTPQKLYYALARLSNARKDRHLSLAFVDGGITLSDTTGADQGNYPVPGSPIPHAPIRFATDYGTPGQYFVFVSDVATDIARHTTGAAPEVGDRLIAVNGRPFADYVEQIEPYHRYSSVNGLWWQIARWIPQKTFLFPPHFYREDLQLELEGPNGGRYSVALPYMSRDDIPWTGSGDAAYPGFSAVFSSSTFDLFRYDERPILLLRWHGFQDGLVNDVDRLMEYAANNELLDYAVVIDATRSRGGSLGAYAVRRLSPKPFKTTFGNLRISDVIPEFVDERVRRFQRGRGPSSPRPGEIDDGTWLTDWLLDDVMEAMRAGRPYSTNVPFKSAHAPKDSDGIIQPAEVHFRGPMVVWLSPYGGSHLDQFASIVVDNDLGHTIGMPAGGYSNTWEWEEVLRFPASGEPVMRFMWSIGHTIRPNGEILEGNPAQVAEFIPVTRDNYESYYQLLLARTLEYLRLSL